VTAMKVFQRVRSLANTVHLVFLKTTLWACALGLLVIVSSWFWGRSPLHELSRSELIQQVDRRNVHDAKFLTSKGTVDVYGKLLQPAASFHVSIAKEDVQDLAYRLQQAGVPTTSAEEIPKGSLGYYATIVLGVPFLALFICVWFLLMRRKIGDLQRDPQKLASIQDK